jgi:hypothetical protein
MLGLTLQSSSREAPARSGLPPGLSAPRRRTIAGASAIFCLCGLGLSATATVIAFFGAGLLLLAQQSGQTGRPEIPPGRFIAQPATAALPAAPKPAIAISAPPAIQSGVLRPAGKVSALAPPAATAIKAPAHQVAAPTSAPRVTADANPPSPARKGAPAGETLPAMASLPRPDAPVPGTPAGAATATPGQRSRPSQSAAPRDQPLSPSLPKAEIASLLVRGDAAFRRGDLATARLFYERAIEGGEGRGALGTGATYDPFFLRRFHLWTQRADPSAARAWYLRARDLGASEAEHRLARLNANPAR